MSRRRQRAVTAGVKALTPLKGKGSLLVNLRIML
jgi:hypothetical protein